VLRRVAAILRSTRVADECFRLGGDEFALLLPDTTVGGAELVAARVAQRVREARLGVEGELTVSCGVAGCEEAEPMALHAAADERLMAAKREPGRASR
jgi:diguanylate cyclase (GGDEF)-like protein